MPEIEYGTSRPSTDEFRSCCERPQNSMTPSTSY